MKTICRHKDGCCGHSHAGEHVHHEGCGCNEKKETSPTIHVGNSLRRELTLDEDEEHHHHEGCGCGDKHEGNDHVVSKTTHKFKVNGLDCANCANKIEKAIQAMPEVKEAALSFSTSLLILNAKADKGTLLKRINEVASACEPGVNIYDNVNKEVVKKTNHNKKIMQLIIGIITLLLAVYLEEKTNSSMTWLFVISYLITGYKVLGTAIRNCLRKEVFDENFLMSIATIGAFYVEDYAEGVAVMLFYGVGELFQSFAVNRSRQSIGDLMDVKSEFATIVKDGKETKVSPEQLQINDYIIVRAGERIPVDGIVTEGSSSLDMSALNGESLPKDIHVQEDVLAGCLNINGVFTMKVQKRVEESTVSRVLELVENAASKKAPIEKFITKFSKVYTPSVVVAAVILVIVPMLMGWGSFEEWLYKGCSFLVISCPCALVVSIPLGLFAGIGGASKQGVLVKGGNYLELLSEVDTIVFDKTGTITKGTFKVSQIIGDNRTLALAAHAENYSNHPIAKSIVEAYGTDIDQSNIRDYKEKAGYGIFTIYEEKVLLVGNERWMSENGISFTASTQLGSHVYVAYDQEYLGCIIINDEIKTSSIEAMRQLDAMGIKKRVMLTGDKQEVAQAIANKVGLSEFHAQLLPQDKVSMLEKYLSPTSKVAFVGDGINDAPVLMRADIGIAMGGIGSDAAIEASDIVLMRDDLSAIPTAIKIAKKTKRILMQNIVFSLLVKLVVLLLAALGFVNMWMGVFADVGVTLLAIINAMRAMRVK